MSDRKLNRDWLHLFVPILLALMFGGAAWGIKLASSSASRNQAQISTATPTPTASPTPTVTPTATPTVTPTPTQVTGGSVKVAPVWVKVRLFGPTLSNSTPGLEMPSGCQPVYSSPDRASVKACVPHEYAFIYLSQQQNGMSAIKCWNPTIPAIDPSNASDWQVCKESQDTGVGWIDSQALVMEKQDANSTF